MKKIKNLYHFNERYCLRTPLLPLNNLIRLLDDIKINEDSLKQQWYNPMLKEAVFLASPYLYSELELLFKNKIVNLNKTEKLKQSLLKYIIRASTRCTPFGLFAGVSIGNFSNATKIVLDDVFNYERKTRLDMNCLVSLIDYFEKDKSVRNQLLYYPNNTLYSIANQYRYVEYKIQNNERQYSLEAIEKSPYIDVVFENAKAGKLIHELASILVSEEISKEEATEFINELINNQILVSELQPSVVGEEPFDTLIDTLKSVKNITEFKSLILLKKNISSLDEKVNNLENKYTSIYKCLDNIKVDYNKKYLLQTDLFVKTKQSNLNTKYAYTILKTLPILCKINSHKTKHKNLEQFKKKFIERYETREIPLTQALDIETGIGYIQNNAVSDTVPFLNDITPKILKPRFEVKSNNPAQNILHKKLLDVLSSSQQQIELTDNDFSNIEINWANYPNMFSSLIELTTIKKEDYIIINSIGGTNASNLLARFCYGNKELNNVVKDICNLEEELSNDKVLAEIVHLPEARAGNILQRPHLRSYEIPYLAKSNLPKKSQISINDILVSVRNNQVILKSKSLNKEISPRLTNAHNYSYKSLPIYHFLCDMQSQNKINNIGFSWGFLNDDYPFLPRVIYKNIILSKARWTISIEEVKKMLDNYNDNIMLMTVVVEWRKSKNLPKLVQLKEGDNMMFINLENITTVRMLLQNIKMKKKFILEEFLMEETSLVKKDEKRFTNQFVFSFYKKN